ncbi:MAG: DUF4012 domain-containing protein [Ardenticatenaceae bacterium]|nr:DUF4012 domain-containing protein [Ardenticatenaceae bacterium]
MSSSPENTPQPRSKHLVRWFILGGLLLLLLGVGQKGWRLFQLSRNFQGHVETIQTIRNGESIDPSEIVRLSSDIRQDTVDLQYEVEPFLPITPYLSWLPRVGPLMPHAEELLAMANEGTYLANLLAPEFAPAFAILQDDRSITEKTPDLITILDQNKALLDQANPIFLQLLNRYERFQEDSAAVAALPDEVEKAMAVAEPFMPVIPHAFSTLQVLPELAGHSESKTYLIIAQNHDELRATGGFISGVGLLTIADGQLGEISFQDAYTVDDFTKPYGLPPQAIEQFMGVQLLVFRDANYWPNFPTSAAKMMELYTYGTGQSVDGLIALDQAFLKRMVASLEPIQVEGYDSPVTSANIDAFLQDAWETGDPNDENWFATRKSFLGPVANAMLRQLIETGDQIEPLPLANAIMESIYGGHLMVYTGNPTIDEPLTAIGLTKTLSPQPHQDFLMILNTNMGFNKANAVVDQEVSYDVQLNPDGSGIGKVVIGYNNSAAASSEPCQQQIFGYSSGENLYSTLINQCYWNYLRVLSPAATELMESSTHPQAAESLITEVGWSGGTMIDAEETPGFVTFSNFLSVPRGEQLTPYFHYQLPRVVQQIGDRYQYTLKIAKQPGIDPYPMRVSITIPPEFSLIESNIPGEVSNGNQISLILDVSKDHVIRITYLENRLN